MLQIVAVEQRVDDAGIALALAALDDVDLLGVVGVEDQHAEDRRGFVGARRRVRHVKAPTTRATSVLLKSSLMSSS